MASHALLHQTPLHLAIKLNLLRHNGMCSLRMANFKLLYGYQLLSCARKPKAGLLRGFSIHGPGSSSARCCAFPASADDTSLRPHCFGPPMFCLRSRADPHFPPSSVARRFRMCMYQPEHALSLLAASLPFEFVRRSSVRLPSHIT